MLLIDTRQPPPEPGRTPWEPNWRLWRWVALTIIAGVAADSSAGVVAYVFAIATLACACQALSVLFPSLDGLREYRQ